MGCLFILVNENFSFCVSFIDGGDLPAFPKNQRYAVCAIHVFN